MGGKTKLARRITDRIRNGVIQRYREPFVGGGSIGMTLVSSAYIPELWLNDVDPSVYCMWTAAARYPEQLKQAVRAIQPSVAEYDRIRTSFLAGLAAPDAADAISRIGAQKLYIQKVSWGAQGQMGTGLRNGRRKNNGAAHWNVDDVCTKIDQISPRLQNARITNLDFSALLEGEELVSVYLDPPYYKVGDRRYQYAFKHVDHLRLRKALRYSEHHWLLSYNDCPEIRDLYGFAHIEKVHTVYTSSSVRKQVDELLISPPQRNRAAVGWMPSTMAA